MSAKDVEVMWQGVSRAFESISFEPLVEVIRQKPYRLVHLRITEDAEQPTGYQLCVGTECKEPSEDVSEITRLLYGEEEV